MYGKDDTGMKWLVNSTARFVRACLMVYARKWSFLSVFALVFLASIAALARFDLLPSPTEAADRVSDVTKQLANTYRMSTLTSSVPELPTKIVISSINLSATIANPTTTNAEVLDQGLLKGAVRYPTSAKLGENGNVVLFGHSSYLPVVGNQAYKTFNGIQKLAVGDTVIVSSSDTAYTYMVKSVTKESANDAVIPLSVAGKELTLSTCDSFALKTDRFVVVADFVESHSVSI